MRVFALIQAFHGSWPKRAASSALDVDDRAKLRAGPAGPSADHPLIVIEWVLMLTLIYT